MYHKNLYDLYKCEWLSYTFCLSLSTKAPFNEFGKILIHCLYFINRGTICKSICSKHIENTYIAYIAIVCALTLHNSPRCEQEKMYDKRRVHRTECGVSLKRDPVDFTTFVCINRANIVLGD